MRPELPERVDEVFASATAEDPCARHASAPEFAADLDAALSARIVLPDQLHQRRRATWIGRNPYKGLLPFQEADAPDYFGRGRLVDRLLVRLGRTGADGRFVALVGPSGAGKSSVIRAGVLPALRRGGTRGSATWFVTTMLPGTHPFEELESALARISGGAVGGLAELMHRDVRGVARAVKQVLPTADGELLLVIDQFEELFTHCRDDQERHRFIDGLVDAVDDARSRLRVVVTMRADFYDRPLSSPALAALFERGVLSLAPLAPDELEQAIVEPARRAGAGFEPGLVARIISDVVDQPGALPLLQYLLTELFDHHDSGTLTLRAYERLGGLSGALSRRAEQLYLSASADERDAVRRLFTRLTTPGDGVEDTRRRVLRTELDATDAVWTVIESFGAARLLAFDHDPGTRTPTIEVAHEALLRAWPRLRGWLEEDRDGLRLHRHLTGAAAAWEFSDHDPGELYRGGRLESAMAWADLHRADLNAKEAAFIDESAAADHLRRTVEARSRRRLRRLLVVVAGVAVIALVAGALALQQRSRAQAQAYLAETERLAASAVTLAVTNQRAALLVAAEAYRRDPGPKTLGAIQRVLVPAAGLQRFIGPTERVESITWLDDHRLAAARPGSLTLYSDEGEVLAAFAGVTATELLYEPTSATLVVGTPQGVRTVDAADGTMSAPIQPDQFVQALAIGPDGLVLVGTKAGLLIGLDPTTGSERFRVTAHPERDVTELGIPGVGTQTIPHLPASAVRGVAAITFDPSSGTVATAGFGYARFWSLGDGMPAPVSEGALTWSLAGNLLAGGPTAAGFVNNGEELLVADPFHEWRVEATTGVVLDDFPVRERLSFVTQGDAIAPSVIDGGRLLTAFTGGFLTVSELDRASATRQVQHGVGEPTAIAVADDGDRTLVSGSEGIVLLSLRGDGPISRALPGVPVGDSGISVNGDMVATNIVQDYRSELWRITDDGAERIDLQGLQPYFIWFSPIPELGYAIDFKHGLVLFDATTGGNHRHVEGWDARRGGNPWLSNDGSMIAIESETGRVGIIDTATATLTDLDPWDPYAPPALPAMAFGPGDRDLYGLHVDGTFVRWDLETGDKVVLGNLGSFGAFGGWMAISPTGELVTAYSSGEVIVRDLETLQPTGVRYDASRPGYPGVGYSQDGTRLVTFFGREMRIWDVAEHEPIGDPLPSDENSLINGSPGAFGLTLVDGTAIRWNLDDRSWPAIVCATAGRNMTPAEWDLFGPRDAPYAATCAQYGVADKEAGSDG